ncbi:MAG: ATP-binding protein [Candidatus Paceibacterota bacterium]
MNLIINYVKNMQISLIEFSLENFKVFKNKATFSMFARKDDKHTFETNGENLLKTSLIYGPNATGKSSILDAFFLIKRMIQLSANIPENQENTKLQYIPFLGTKNNNNLPIVFEVTFSLMGIHDGIYRYEFSFLQDHIVSEKLVGISSKDKEDIFFSRNGQNIKVEKDFKDMKDLLNKVRKESLFLSVSAQLNNSFALDILNAFNSIIVVSGIHPMGPKSTIKKIKEDEIYKEKFLNLLKVADFCVTRINTKEIDTQQMDFKLDAGKMTVEPPKTIKNDVLLLGHPIYDENNKAVDVFELDLFQESSGTLKFSMNLGPVIDALEGGKILFIDEFDNSLHPLLTKLIIDLFESQETNKNNAQLIVTTHDVSLLSYREDFIKDQFWFTEKDEFGSAKLFSLGEFNIRNDTEYAKKYLEGRFGALPFISSLDK